MEEERSVIPQKLSGYREQQDIHLSYELLVWEFRPYSSDILGEVMIGEVDGVFVVEVEVLDDIDLASPHEYVMLRVSEMRGQTRAKVASPEDEDFGVAGRL